jgi:hypothetical protein
MHLETGSTESISFLKMLGDLNPDHPAFTSKAISKYVEYKWRQLVFIGYAQTFMYLIYLVCLCFTHNKFIIIAWFTVHLGLEVI